MTDRATEAVPAPDLAGGPLDGGSGRSGSEPVAGGLAAALHEAADAGMWAERAWWLLAGFLLIDWAIRLQGASVPFPFVAVAVLLIGVFGLLCIVEAATHAPGRALRRWDSDYGWLILVVFLAAYGIFAFVEIHNSPGPYLLISADDHIVEPPDTFDGRLPARFADRAPRVVEHADGRQVWVYDGQELPNVGFNAVIGRPVSEYGFEPVRFDEMRRGAWDIEARIADMDLNGVYASLNFPSFLPGFAGQRLQLLTKDRGLALAAVRAWNDWHIEAWAGPHPDRIIPCQIPWLLDPAVGAVMIRENAARGFKAVTFPESPAGHGLPTLHSGHWDPMIEACAETGTVINLHIGSSGASPTTTDDAPPDVTGVLFFGYAMYAAVDWLYSLYPLRFPQLKICLSEGGIGWVAALMDRLDHMLSYHDMYGTWKSDLTPAEVLKRNFWFCAVEDPSAFVQRERIGVGNILLEQDYPHCDSTWPRTQELAARQLAHLPAGDITRITWQNAAELYRHPVPREVQSDPDAY